MLGFGGGICGKPTNLKIQLREKNIKANKKQISWEDVDCIHLVQDEGKWQIIVSTVIKLWIL
jgi:hypothetical protein